LVFEIKASTYFSSAFLAAALYFSLVVSINTGSSFHTFSIYTFDKSTTFYLTFFKNYPCNLSMFFLVKMHYHIKK
jgi:hypothetical protein